LRKKKKAKSWQNAPIFVDHQPTYIALPATLSHKGPSPGIGSFLKRPPRTNDIDLHKMREFLCFFLLSTSLAFRVPQPFLSVSKKDTSWVSEKAVDWVSEAQCVALVAGSTVGGGVLALPTACADLGLRWSYAEIFGTWALMAATGFALADAACAEKKSVTLKELFEKRLGSVAGLTTGVLLMSSNALLLAAYATEGGKALGDFVGNEFSLIAFCVVAAGAVAFLETATLDLVNSMMVVVMALSFTIVVNRWAPFCGDVFEDHVFPGYASLAAALPVVSSALVYQSIVPVVADKLDRDSEKTKRAVLFGSLVPALCYAVFAYAVLGRFRAGESFVFGSDGLLDPLAGLPSMDQSRLALSAFSLCAVSTSFVGTALSQTHELRGLLPAAPSTSLALLPPALAALFFKGDDSFFLFAIAATGAIANPLLFAAFPSAIYLKSIFAPQEPRRPKHNNVQLLLDHISSSNHLILATNDSYLRLQKKEKKQPATKTKTITLQTQLLLRNLQQRR